MELSQEKGDSAKSFDDNAGDPFVFPNMACFADY